MARQPTTQLDVSGHRFLVRRTEHALLRRDVSMLTDPMRSQRRSMMAGCALAVIAVAGSAILALVRPQDALGDAPIVMVKESGALYVRIADTLHPVLNLASARLVAGTAADPDVVRESELRKAKRGPLLGISGAPAVIPEPWSEVESEWTVCDDASGTTVIAGRLNAAAQASDRTVLVRSGSATYLLYDGTRAEVDLADTAVVRSLGLEGVEPSAVSAAVLNAIPEVPPITAPPIPRAGQRGPASMGGLPAGTVVRVNGAGAVEYYVVLTEGVQRVGQVAADLIRFADSRGSADIVTVTADAIGGAPLVDVLPVNTFPDRATKREKAAVVCARSAAPDECIVFAGATLPLAPGQTPVNLARADRTGPNVDAVFVPPGRSLYVRSTDLYLVTDTGVRFGIPDSATATTLGLTATPVPAPWSILKLLPNGPRLSKDSALLMHDAVTALPGAAPPR